MMFPVDDVLGDGDDDGEGAEDNSEVGVGELVRSSAACRVAAFLAGSFGLRWVVAV
ncbi:hypothetical protein DIPPA_10320 [Diplonema papillatum]|nr:hypothetical protein DIPPA_10320 [Diplonema papillatum]